ncbi:MAG TPA: sigma-70 family RNA polymerase sigma factor [Microlunatus sp.]|nr:sigma-70 family RNA polymerase sigma factor [Microlunatus sp.]
MAATVHVLESTDRCAPDRPAVEGSGLYGRDLAERTRARLREGHRCGGVVLRQARDAVVVDHLWLARAIAHRYLRRGEDVEDLLQAARMGLVEAVNRYDPDRGEFIPFAAVTISGVVKRHFRDRGWLIRPSRHTQEVAGEIGRSWPELVQELGRVPSTEELAACLGESVEEILRAQQATDGYRALSVDVLDEGPYPIGVSDDAVIDRVEAQLMVRSVLRDLDGADRDLIRMRFVEDRSQAEIAARIGTSQMEVSRRLSRLFARLRPLLDSEHGVRIAS